MSRCTASARICSGRSLAVCGGVAATSACARRLLTEFSQGDIPFQQMQMAFLPGFPEMLNH